MIPLYDENRSKSRPYITWLLIVINVIVFIWQLDRGFTTEDVFNYGAIPASIMRGERLYTLLTSMFMHGGFAHIIGNLLYLFIFGDNVEDRFGHFKHLLFYLLFGLVGGLTHFWFTIQLGGMGAELPAIGASGAVSGVLGAYVLLFPNARIVTLVLYGYFGRIARIRSLYYLGFWFLYQFIASRIDPFGGVAYWAHIGGFIAGFFIAIPFRIYYSSRRRTLKNSYYTLIDS